MKNLKKEDEVKQGMLSDDDQNEMALEPQDDAQEDIALGSQGEDDGIRTSGEGEESVQEQGVADNSQGAPIQPEPNQVEQPKFTQSQVNEMMGRARQEGRESVLKALLEKYGVNGEDELGDLLGRGQSFDDINFDLENSNKELKDARSENALLKSGILKERWDDAKAILGAKGLEISEEALNAMIPTHPEWMKQELPKNTPLSEEDMQNAGIGTAKPSEDPATLTRLGTEPTPQPQETDREIASKLFGLDFTK